MTEMQRYSIISEQNKQAASLKRQAASAPVKHQAPSSKHQAPSRKQQGPGPGCLHKVLWFFARGARLR